MVDCQTVTYLLVVCPQTPSPSYSTCIPAPPGIIILICLFLGSHLDWPYCSTNSSFPSAPIPGFCFQPPTNPASHSASFYVIIYRALIPFMLFPSFPEEDLPQLITAHCSVTPKSVPGNTNASTSSYKNTKERKEWIPWKNSLQYAAHSNSHRQIHNLHQNALGSGNPMV